jgi:hypothetical protein
MHCFVRANLQPVVEEPGGALLALMGATLAAILTSVVAFFLSLAGRLLLALDAPAYR